MNQRQQYDNELRGILTRNDRKVKDTHPDHRGQCTIDGVEYWISAWIETGRSGKLAGQRYFSLRFEPKEQQPRAAAPRKAPAPVAAGYANPVQDMEDDIPF